MPPNSAKTRIFLALGLLLGAAVAGALLVSRTGDDRTIPASSARALSTPLVPAPAPSAPKPASPSKAAAPVQRSHTLTSAKLAHWAVVLKPARAFARPSSGARVRTTLPAMTSDKTQNIVQVVSETVVAPHAIWYEVRLAILPNNSRGWVPKAALGRLYSVHTHLYVDLEKTTATLKRNGVTIFKTIIGVGLSGTPTPRGQFYIRDELTDFHNPFYGPVAFGTSARSATLTDWPNGGFIGVHGTDQPAILPGRVSHGCVRMPNASILTLARLMPVGTPVTIT
jgi:lipoprotein-anchoring transpeptidase ErfK/SrfK